MDKQEKMNFNEVSNEDESAEEVKSKNIFLKFKQFLSDQIFFSFLDEIEIDDITHYTEEVQKIALKWNEERRK